MTTNAISPKDAASRLYAMLTAEQIAYAQDMARGEYRGFAALHDLCDANQLLIDVGCTADGEYGIPFAGRVIAEVNCMLLGKSASNEGNIGRLAQWIRTRVGRAVVRVGRALPPYGIEQDDNDNDM